MQRLILVLLVACLGVMQVDAATYVVKPDGTGDFPTIRDAVQASMHGDVIELADGTFMGDGNRDIDYGGKMITIRSQSGNPEACILDPEGAHPDTRHRGFVFQSGENPMAQLERVKITNGYVGGGQNGGAILCDQGSSPTIRECVFEQNVGFSGGGAISCKNGSGPEIIDCLFLENEGTEQGGGGLMCRSSSPTVTRCDFVGNESTRGGGVLVNDDSDVLLKDCNFSGNTAFRGGAVEVYSSHLSAVGCEFEGGSAFYGGAISFSWQSTGTISQCFLSGNSGTIGGAVMCDDGSTPEFEGCTFLENSGNYGGGMAAHYSAPAARHCTFVSNAANTEGGGFYLYDGGLVLENCIVAFGGQGEAVTCAGGANATLSCCDLFGNAGGDWVGCVADQSGTNGNISEDPLFCGSQNPEEPYTLQEDSPCAPESNPECGLIGAWPVACGPTSSVPNGEPVRKVTTWGLIKEAYRR